MNEYNQGCIWNHNVPALYGIPPQPISELPTYCTCGEQFVYAEHLMFVELDMEAAPTCYYDENGDLVMTSEPVKISNDTKETEQ